MDCLTFDLWKKKKSCKASTPQSIYERLINSPADIDLDYYKNFCRDLAYFLFMTLWTFAAADRDADLTAETEN